MPVCIIVLKERGPLQMSSSNNVDVSYVLKSEKRYNKFKNDLKKEILDDFSKRHDPIQVVLSDKTIPSTKGALLLNMFFMRFFVASRHQISSSEYYTKDSISQGNIENEFNDIQTITLNEKICTDDEFRNISAEILNEMSGFSTIDNVLAGNTIDYEDFLLAMQDPDAKQIFYPEIPKKAQYNEIEKFFKSTGKEIEKYYTEHKEYDFSPFVRSGSGVNLKQCTQTLSFVGLKPNIATGQVIPHVIDDNFLKGLTTIENYFINAEGTRGALCTNHRYTRESGYNNRKLSLLMIDTWQDDDDKDCGTEHFIDYDINSDAKLKLIDGRNYYDLNGNKADYKHLKEISYETDKALIGKHIALRSPVCCISNSDHNRVCATCYGRKLSTANKNFHTGLVSVLEINSVLTQTLLSAKHLLSTSTDKIEWQPIFVKNFVMQLDEIYFNESAVNAELCFEMPTEDDYDEDEGMYEIKHFTMKDEETKKPVELDAPVPMYINPSLIEGKSGTIKLNSTQIGSETMIFKFVPHNNMLTKKLMDIIDLIESSGHLGIETVDQLVNKFADLLIANDMGSINLIHAEMICSKLIKTDEGNHYIDWSKKEIPPYHINRVSKSVLESPIAVSLSFERLNDQFSDINTYNNPDRQKESIMDYQFK
jgi:hypothetical protein